MALFGKGGGKPAEDPLSLIQSGRFKEAISLLQAKLKREPHDVTTRRRLAEAYEGAGRGKDAAAIYRLEGESCLASGDRAKGLAFLRKAAKVDPADESIPARIADLEGRGSSNDDDNFSFDMGSDEEPAATVPIPAVAVPVGLPAPPLSPKPAQPSRPVAPPDEEETGFSMEPSAPHQVAFEEPIEPAIAEAEETVSVEPEPELERDLGVEMASARREESRELAPAPIPQHAQLPGHLKEPPAVPMELEPEVELLPLPEPEMEAAPEPLPIPGPLEELPIEAVPLPEIEAEDFDPFAIPSAESPSAEPAFKATRAAESDEVGLMLGAFPGLDAMDVMELIACFGCMTLQPGEILIREGDAGEAVYLVIRGKLVARALLGGHEVELASLCRGDVLGEVSFLHNVPRTATVTALESTVVLEMPGASAKEQLAAMPHIKDRLEALIAERVERTVALVKERMREHPQG